MKDRPRFVAPKQTPAGLWRRMPPMVFVPALTALSLAMAWRLGIGAFSLPPGLADFLSGIAMALFLFVAIAYGTKIARRPGVVGDEIATLPGRVGVDAGVVALLLSGAVMAPFSVALGRALLVLGLGALIVLSWLDLRQIRLRQPDASKGEPAWQLRWTALLVAAAVAPMLGWTAFGQLLIYPGVWAALIGLGLAMRQLRVQRVPKVLLPLMALHLVPLTSYGIAAVGVAAPFQDAVFGLTVAGLLVVVVLAWRAGRGLFQIALTVPVSFAAWFLVAFAAAQPASDGLRILGGLILIAATLTCLPLVFITLRDWARGQLATRSNAAIA